MCWTTTNNRTTSGDWSLGEEDFIELDLPPERDNSTDDVGHLRRKLGLGSLVMATAATMIHDLQKRDAWVEDELKDESTQTLVAGTAIFFSLMTLLLHESHILEVPLSKLRHWWSSNSLRQHSSHISIAEIATLQRTVSKNSLDAAKRLRESSAAGLVQLSEAVKHLSWAQKPRQQQHVSIFSKKESFIPVGTIAHMTLQDMATLLQYAVELNQDGFAAESFHLRLCPLLREIKVAMDAAMQQSRGEDVLVMPSSSAAGAADMDALAYCAVMRVFAEWRMVRQVPDGYKAYSAGMSMGRRDLIQNVAKLESATHVWIDHQRAHAEENTVPSPTLRQLLQYEVDHQLHRQLPKLNDKTAAIGLLWSKRQVEYATALYSSFRQVPSTYQDAKTAAKAAYHQVYDAYHGWMIQKVFIHSLQAAPPTEVIYKFMTPEYRRHECNKVDVLPILQETTSFDTSSQSGSDNEHEDDFASWEDAQSFEEASHQDDKKEDHPLGWHIAQAWDQTGKNIQKGWDDFIRGTVELFQNKAAKEKERMREQQLRQQYKHQFAAALSNRYKFHPQLSLKDSPLTMQGDSNEPPVSRPQLPRRRSRSQELQEITDEAHGQIDIFIKMAQPLLKDLSELMEEFNMNDPTRV